MNYRTFRLIKGNGVMCRRCNAVVETQAHVFNHCKENPYGPTRKHNKLLNILNKFLTNKGMNVDMDEAPAEIQTTKRPDLVIRDYRAKNTFVLDMKVPYDDSENFKFNRSSNSEKYGALTDAMCHRNRHKLYLNVINVGCLGSWDPENDIALKRIGLSEAEIMKVSKELIVAAVKESYHIYLSHVTGRRYDPNLILPPLINR